MSENVAIGSNLTQNTIVFKTSILVFLLEHVNIGGYVMFQPSVHCSEGRFENANVAAMLCLCHQ